MNNVVDFNEAKRIRDEEEIVYIVDKKNTKCEVFIKALTKHAAEYKAEELFGTLAGPFEAREATEEDIKDAIKWNIIIWTMDD